MNKKNIKNRKIVSIGLLCSYLAIILAPAAAIITILFAMQNALLDIQGEKIRSLSREAVVTYNMEIEQLEKVAEYIVRDTHLKKYMGNSEDISRGASYYHAYELAQSYPDYVLLNRFIRNAYILPLDGDYLIQIPRVVPNDQRGIASTGILYPEALIPDFENYLYDSVENGLFYATGSEFRSRFFVMHRFAYESSGEKSGVIVIEIEEKQVQNVLSQTLGEDTGMAFLIDPDGNVLSSWGTDAGTKEEVPVHWSSYLEERGWEENEVVVNQIVTDHNGWSVVTVIPRVQLLSKIGTARMITLAICVVSILIGVMICLWYWNRDKEILEKCLHFLEKQEKGNPVKTESFRLWANVGGILNHAEALRTTVEMQKQLVLEGIIRKVLHGDYDSDQAFEQELKEMGVTFPVSWPCRLVKVNIEKTDTEEKVSLEEVQETIRNQLSASFPDFYWMFYPNAGSCILLVGTGEKNMGGWELKEKFEQFNYDVYSRIPVNIYTGISDPAGNILELADEYEHACRICEYTEFYKLRTPCLMEDMPKNHFVVFTLEMEMQIEKIIKSGTREQMEEIMTRIQEICLYSIQGVLHPHSEILRHILLRSLDESEPEGLTDKIHRARQPADMESCVWKLWEYYENRRTEQHDQDTESLKMRIEEEIEKRFVCPEINLTMLAEIMGIQEKKLYRDFKMMFGVSFSTYLEMKRIHHAGNRLKDGMSVREVAESVGYNSDYSFRRAFKRVMGFTPSDYQKIHRNSIPF